MVDNKRYCKKCGYALDKTKFYRSNDLDKYPDECLDICKQCLNKHIDNYNPITFLWILKEIDVPYIPKEWAKLLARYGRDRSKLTGGTILGRYLAKMKLKSFKCLRWKDNFRIYECQFYNIYRDMNSRNYSFSEIHKELNVCHGIDKFDFSLPEKEG